MQLPGSLIQHLQLPGAKLTAVHGGDINAAYRVLSGGSTYFLKLNDAALYPSMFVKEANGLNALRSSTALTVPTVVDTGIAGSQQYLLLEWIERGAPSGNFWKYFGKKLAMLHLQEQDFFGWPEDNYIGSLPQVNTKQESWASFYAECRLLPLVTVLSAAGHFSPADVEAAESFCAKLDALFPVEAPALLHGDLWSGNFMVTGTGTAAIFDPAVYAGHREMDIGMSKLFGGFDNTFYDAYNEVYPLKKGWEERLPLTQLYPLLVHAVLFGGHYIAEARQIFRSYS